MTIQNGASKSQLGLVLLLIGWESDAIFLSQSQSVAMQIQSNYKITFDTQLKIALFWLLTCVVSSVDSSSESSGYGSQYSKYGHKLHKLHTQCHASESVKQQWKR